MRDLKSFGRVSDNKPDCEKKERAEEMVKEREGKSEDELTRELLQEVQKAKISGKFNEKEIDDFKNRITPFLNEEQKVKLQEILEKIK